MDANQLREVEANVSKALREDDGPFIEEKLQLAVHAFLAFDADGYIQAKGVRCDRRVVLWIHALSHFTRELWELRQYEHLQALYREAHKRSSEVGDYGCMDRLLEAFLEHARWFHNPRDYGFDDALPDYELLYAEREQDTREMERITEERKGIKYAYEQELIRIRLRGFQTRQEASEWRSLQRVGWQKGY